MVEWVCWLGLGLVITQRVHLWFVSRHTRRQDEQICALRADVETKQILITLWERRSRVNISSQHSA